uniref:Uncharacterized protein n=1 Tax=Roseihalotalea indica TaxID=2867963 RepID=A0AA49GSC8_9BACT|nr:hypothetical protein K4G66_04105 [Tunicatimonas sp. TK19036]
MKWKYVALIPWLAGSLAQAQNTKLLKAPFGKDVMHLVPEGEQYRYSGFRPGKVHFVSGATSSATLNYNLLNQEMQFINPVGDTLSIAQEKALDLIKIGEQQFYYRPTIGYLEVLAEVPLLTLAVHQLIEVTEDGRSSILLADPVSKKQNSQSTADQRTRNLKLSKKNVYFIMDKNKRFHPAQRTTFYRIFPEHKTSIRNYIQEHHIRFDQPEALTEMITYCSQLTNSQ